MVSVLTILRESLKDLTKRIYKLTTIIKTMKIYNVTTVYSFRLYQSVEAINELEAQSKAYELDSNVDEKGLIEALSHGWEVEATYIDEETY